MKKLYINFPTIELSGDIYRQDIMVEMKMRIEHEMRNPEWHKKLDIIAKEVFNRVLENLNNELLMKDNLEMILNEKNK